MKLMLFDIMYSKDKMYKIISKTTSIADVVYVYLNKKILKKRKLYVKFYTFLLKQFVIKKEEYIYILSKNIPKNTYDEYLKSITNLKKVMLNKNSILENSIKYLRNEKKSSSILLVVDFKVQKDIIEEYVKHFKEVKIYVNKENLKRVDTSMIRALQEEYGTIVDIITNDKKVSCDITVFLEDINVDNSLINSRKIYILTENILDRFSNEYKIYNRYKAEIENYDNYLSRNLSAALAYLYDLNKK